MVVISNSHELAAANGLPDAEGVVAIQFARDGAGANAGLHRGDVLVKLNGKSIRSEDDYKAEEKQLRIGQQITVDLLRDNTKMSGKLTVGEAP
jgi:S1-C subfamily serine protease